MKGRSACECLPKNFLAPSDVLLESLPDGIISPTLTELDQS